MADIPALTTYVTEADLDALGSDARVEVVNGAIVEMSPVGTIHEIIVQNLNRILDRYVIENNLGLVFTDSLIFYLRREGKRLYQARIPDVSFVRMNEFPSEWNLEKPFPQPPTLAVEVMSPDDSPDEVLEKVREYLDAGTEQVWVVYPRTKEVHQFIGGAAVVRTYRGTESIDVGSLFPNLNLPLELIFKLPIPQATKPDK